MGEPSTADLGEVVGNYRLEEKIGAGGMGTVYAASHVRLTSRRAAVKLISRQFLDDDDALSRFYHEAQVVNAVKHPNIVDIFDFVEKEEPRRVACVMEFLEGPSLRQALEQGPFTTQQAVNAIGQLCDALSAVHEIGIVHRDLKPGNIVVVGDRSGDLSEVPAIKLLDFGIAKVPVADAAHRTATGAIMGTPAYMAPEQIGGDSIGPETDVYAVGEILYEMLTGKRVFSGESMKIFQAKLSDKPPELERVPGVPAALFVEIERCLRWEPSERPSAAEVRKAIQMVPLDQTVAAPAPPTPLQRYASHPPVADDPARTALHWPKPVQKKAPKKKRGGLVLLVLMLAVAAAGAFAFVQLRGAEAPAVTTPAVNPMDAVTVRWAKELGPPKDTVETYLDTGRRMHMLDTEAGYAKADRAYRSAAVLEPANVEAVAGWAENLFVWREDMLGDEARRTAAQAVGYVAAVAPDSPAVLRARAAMAFAKGDPVTCAQLARRAVQLDADDGHARLLLANAYVGGAADAEREAQAATRVNPQLARRERVLARAFGTAQRYRRAFELLNGRLRKMSRDGKALELYGDLERELGRSSAAHERYRRAIAVQSNLHRVRLKLGRSHLERNETSDAARVFRTLAKAKDVPADLLRRAHVGVARAELERNRTTAAASAVAEAKAIGSTPDVMLLEAEVAFAKKDLATAANLAKKLVRLEPRDPAVAVLLARIATLDKSADDAIKALRRALAANPHDAELRTILASVYLSFGAADQAFEVTRAAARFDPYERSSRDPTMAIAGAAVNAAKAAVRREASRSRTAADANAALALLALYQGQRGTARTLAGRARARKRGHALASMIDAHLAFESNSLGRAEAILKAWLAAEPQAAVAHLMLARIHTKRGREREATAALNDAARFGALALVRTERAALDLRRNRDAAIETLTAEAIAHPKLSRPRRLLYDARR